MSEPIAPRPNDGFKSSRSSPLIPDAASLYGITRRHGRERILVKPLLWTGRHLDLLRISFEEPSSAPNIDLTDYHSGGEITDFEERSLEYHLRRFHLLENREEYFNNMFCLLGSPVCSDWSIYHINLSSPSAKGLYSTAPGEGIYLRKPRAQWSDPYYPIGAYIDRGRVEELRKESLKFHVCNPQNAPVYSILSHKLERLRPANPFKDPYIAALLIAIAQERRSVLEAEKPEDLSALKTYPSQVLYSSESKTYVYLYKADIPSSFLDMLDYPKIAPPELPQISIQVFKIPLSPVGTFRDRILTFMLQTASDRSTKAEN